nr:doublecortin domain-containing protein 2-like [Pelodiscus sinensis]|eukprot:XP_025045288.1 doublecortin domain-containing protein 2-like [Pelodiscus sinensis]
MEKISDIRYIQSLSIQYGLQYRLNLKDASTGYKSAIRVLFCRQLLLGIVLTVVTCLPDCKIGTGIFVEGVQWKFAFFTAVLNLTSWVIFDVLLSVKYSASHQPPCRPSAKSEKSPKPADGKAQSVFYAKESKEGKKARPERATPLPSDKAPSIFKAGKPRGEVQGAAEVQEDKNLKVEMPIDQVPAQIVQEEEIVAPASSPADEVEEDGNPYEDIEKKEKKKEWSFKNMFGFFLKKPAESKDNKEESKQEEEEKEKQPEKETIPEQINDKKET